MENSSKAFYLVVILFVGVFLWLVFWLPSNMPIFNTYPPANTTYTAANSTEAFRLSVQTVPTVVNGITTVTSIIVGFSGALTGIILRGRPKEAKQDNRARRFLMVGVPVSIGIIILLDFFAYAYLLMGGVWFQTALLSVLSGLLWALFVLIGIFIYIGFRLNEEKSESAIPLTATPLTTIIERPEETESQKLKREFQNRATEP
jgi:hypothetical protein